MTETIVRILQNEKGLGIFDTIIVCILMSVLIGTAFPYYQKLQHGAKEAALQTGLANIRKGVELYNALQGHYPNDLKILINAKYVIPMREDTFFSGEYLRAQAQDAEGNLLDPFGNRYGYDSKSGKVFSETNGYRTW